MAMALPYLWQRPEHKKTLAVNVISPITERLNQTVSYPRE